MTGSADFGDEIDCASFFDQMDDLIDFPADNGCCGLGFGSSGGGASNNFPSIWSNPPDVLQACDTIFYGNNSNSASDLSAELSVPYEDMVQLEWLSNFVEDSFSGAGMTLDKHDINKHFQTSSPVSVPETTAATTTATTTTSSSSSSSSTVGNPTPLNPIQRGPHRARSKRPRPANFVESHLVKMMSKAAAEEQKVGMLFPLVPAGMNQNQNPPSQSVRKCMHCEITKTPQWRAGPMGPKTLCNACGVRYKSGRLFPEYRPAASPTFVPSLHSNSHRKVLEMRTKPFEPEVILKRSHLLDL